MYLGNGQGRKEMVFLGGLPVMCDQLDQVLRGVRGEVVLPRKISGPREVRRSKRRECWVGVAEDWEWGLDEGSLGQMRPV